MFWGKKVGLGTLWFFFPFFPLVDWCPSWCSRFVMVTACANVLSVSGICSHVTIPAVRFANICWAVWNMPPPPSPEDLIGSFCFVREFIVAKS